jgi:hypothetical protein
MNSNDIAGVIFHSADDSLSHDSPEIQCSWGFDAKIIIHQTFYTATCCGVDVKCPIIFSFVHDAASRLPFTILCLDRGLQKPAPR